METISDESRDPVNAAFKSELLPLLKEKPGAIAIIFWLNSEIEHLGKEDGDEVTVKLDVGNITYAEGTGREAAITQMALVLSVLKRIAADYAAGAGEDPEDTVDSVFEIAKLIHDTDIHDGMESTVRIWDR